MQYIYIETDYCLVLSSLNAFMYVISFYKTVNMLLSGNSLAVQGLGFCASTVGGTGLISGWGTRIPQAE